MGDLNTLSEKFEDARLAEKKQDTEFNFNQAIVELQAMTDFERETARKEISDKYNVRVSFIDKIIAAIEREKDDDNNKKIVEDIRPAAKSVDGAELLDEIMDKLVSFVVLPEGTAAPISLWVMLTYCTNAFRILPLLGIVSPVKRCGKTTLLEFFLGVVSKGLTASNISPAAVYRTVEKYQPTLLVDEADTFLKDNNELRGIINSGHTRSGAFVIRTQGDDHEPVRFSTWGSKRLSR